MLLPRLAGRDGGLLVPRLPDSLPIFQVDFQDLPITFEEPFHVLLPGSVAQPADVDPRHPADRKEVAPARGKSARNHTDDGAHSFHTGRGRWGAGLRRRRRGYMFRQLPLVGESGTTRINTAPQQTH